MSGRRNSSSDYPEHLNPFYEGNDKWPFWGKIKRSSSFSNSLRELRNSITLRSFRGSKKSKSKEDDSFRIRNHSSDYSSFNRTTIPIYRRADIQTSTPLLPRSRFSERVRKSASDYDKLQQSSSGAHETFYDSSKNPFENDDDDDDTPETKQQEEVSKPKNEENRKKFRRKKRRAPLPPGMNTSKWSLTSVETDTSYSYSEVSDMDVSELEKPMTEICEVLQTFTKEIEKMTDLTNNEADVSTGEIDHNQLPSIKIEDADAPPEEKEVEKSPKITEVSDNNRSSKQEVEGIEKQVDGEAMEQSEDHERTKNEIQEVFISAVRDGEDGDKNDNVFLIETIAFTYQTAEKEEENEKKDDDIEEDFHPSKEEEQNGHVECRNEAVIKSMKYTDENTTTELKNEPVDRDIDNQDKAIAVNQNSTTTELKNEFVDQDTDNHDKTIAVNQNSTTTELKNEFVDQDTDNHDKAIAVNQNSTTTELKNGYVDQDIDNHDKVIAVNQSSTTTYENDWVDRDMDNCNETIMVDYTITIERRKEDNHNVDIHNKIDALEENVVKEQSSETSRDIDNYNKTYVLDGENNTAHMANGENPPSVDVSKGREIDDVARELKYIEDSLNETRIDGDRMNGHCSSVEIDVHEEKTEKPAPRREAPIATIDELHLEANNNEYVPYKETCVANGNENAVNLDAITRVENPSVSSTNAVDRENEQQKPIPKVRKKKFTKAKLLGFFGSK